MQILDIGCRYPKCTLYFGHFGKHFAIMLIIGNIYSPGIHFYYSERQNHPQLEAQILVLPVGMDIAFVIEGNRTGRPEAGC